MYMSIATLARKSRAQRGASTRTGWTLATTKSGNCPGPCGGGAPAKQKSMRRLMASMAKGGDPLPGGMQSNECCKTTYKEVIKPDGDQSASGHTWLKKQWTHNCIKHVHWSIGSGSGYQKCQRHQYHEQVLKVRFTGTQAYFYHPSDTVQDHQSLHSGRLHVE